MLRGRLLLLLLLIAAPSTTHAASLAIQTVAFNGTFDALAVKRFDPALGTLDSVGVTITGVLAVNGFVPQTTGVVVPSVFAVTVEQTFDGIGGDFFDFGSPARFVLNGSTPGAPFTLNAAFTHSFRFTPLTDIVGFVIPSVSGPAFPPTTVDGRLSDFLGDPAVPGFIALAHTATALPIGGQPPVLTSTTSQGIVILEYRYTPATTPSVPEPATAWLLTLGLGLAVRRLGASMRVS